HRHLHSFPTRRSSDLVMTNMPFAGVPPEDGADALAQEATRSTRTTTNDGRALMATSWTDPPPVPAPLGRRASPCLPISSARQDRSEEHTSELQSRGHL